MCFVASIFLIHYKNHHIPYFMEEMDQQSALLLLEDGTLFRGKAAGKVGTTTGETCFNTGMTGYQEIFTNPSFNKETIGA